MEFTKGGKTFGGALLVAGTAIGGGMLALPVLTAEGGFFPSILIYVLCWLSMTATGLLFMEVFLWSEKEVNIVSMASMTLGLFGKVVAWVLYLFLFYSLSVAYVSGGGGLVTDVFEAFDAKIPLWTGPLLFVLLFAPFVAIGPKAVDKANVILMGGLILSFLVFVFLGIFNIQLSFLTPARWPFAFLSIPVIFTSFGFQGIVPTLTNYLGRDPFKVKRAIFFGSLVPLVVYILWEGLILGVIPLEDLVETKRIGGSAVMPLRHILDLPWLFRVGEFFAFFAIVTSFLGVTMGLLDFLADGLKIKKNVAGRAALSFLIFFPPLVFGMLRPCIFLHALRYGGGIGGALLLGLLPVLMVWRGRYRLKFKSDYSLGGGRLFLSFLIAFILFALIMMLVKIQA